MTFSRITLILFVSLLASVQSLAAKEWTRVAEGDGYRSSSEILYHREDPQKLSRVATVAQDFVGTSYRWGGTNPVSGFGTSGLVYEVMRLNGYDFPRSLESQFENTQPVERSNLSPGDLVFFSSYLTKPSYVGIYLKDGDFVHSSPNAGAVVVSQLDEGHYAERFLSGGRLTQATAAETLESPDDYKRGLVSTVVRRQGRERTVSEADAEPTIKPYFRRGGYYSRVIEPAPAYFSPHRVAETNEFDFLPPVRSAAEERLLAWHQAVGELASAWELQLDSEGRSLKTLLQSYGDIKQALTQAGRNLGNLSEREDSQ
jgi:hypothetical protein